MGRMRVSRSPGHSGSWSPAHGGALCVYPRLSFAGASIFLEGIFGSSCNRQPHQAHGVVKSSALKKVCGVGSCYVRKHKKCLQNIGKDDGIQKNNRFAPNWQKHILIQTLMFSSSLSDLPVFNKYLLSAYYTPGTGNVSSEKSRHNPCLPRALHCTGRWTLRRSQRRTLKSPGCLELSDTCHNRLKFLTSLPPLGSPVQFWNPLENP